MKKSYCKPVTQVLYFNKVDVVTASIVSTSVNDVWGDDLYEELLFN